MVPPTSSSLAEERTPLLPPPQHVGRAITDDRSWDWELLAHRAHGSAYFVVTRRGKNASAPSSSARRARDYRRSQLGSGAARASRAWFRLLRRHSQRKERLCSLLCPLLAPLAEAGARKPLPSSLARRRKACLLARSSRTAAGASLAQHVGRAITDARSWDRELLAHRAHSPANPTRSEVPRGAPMGTALRSLPR
jgi:hypothetical protein